MTANYLSPVDKLLALGDPRGEREWPDYLALGIGTGQVTDLVRMALDQDLRWADSESKEVWANLHAWRALGQLRAEAAIEPLKQLFRRIDEDNDDWIGEELPEVYGMIGPAALPALSAFLADSANGLWARTGASSALEEIGKRHPDARAECVAALTKQLERFAENDPTLNGSLVASLLDLSAVESTPIMKRAFAAKKVDESVAGDWEDVQIEFGLIDERSTPRAPTELDRLIDRITARTNRPESRKAETKPIEFLERDDVTGRVISRMLATGEFKRASKVKEDKLNKKDKKKK